MPSFRIDNLMILQAMAVARRAEQDVVPVGASLVEAANVAPATGDAACAQAMADWATNRMGDLVQLLTEINQLLERLRLASTHYVNTEAAIADMEPYLFDWTLL